MHCFFFFVYVISVFSCKTLIILGTEIKQADVVLLGYPLQEQTSEQVRLNDLTYYEQVVS